MAVIFITVIIGTIVILAVNLTAGVALRFTEDTSSESRGCRMVFRSWGRLVFSFGKGVV